jgi:hypothetical protein
VQYQSERDRRRAERAERRAREAERPRRSRGMLIAGVALFAGGYVPPAIIGLGLGTQDRKECDCRDALRLLIPVAGPLTLWKPNKDLNFFFNSLMVLDSLVQTAGVVLTVFGIIKYNESAQNEELGRLREPRLTYGITPLPGGAYGGLRLQL